MSQCQNISIVFLKLNYTQVWVDVWESRIPTTRSVLVVFISLALACARISVPCRQLIEDE